MLRVIEQFGLSHGILIFVIGIMVTGYGALALVVKTLFGKIEEQNKRQETLLGRIEELYNIQTRIVAVAGQRLEGEEFRRAISDALRGVE